VSETYQIQLCDNQYHPYKIIHSQRAKYIRIKISNDGEIRVVLPRGIADKHAHSFLQRKIEWITKTISKIPSVKDREFPEQLSLKLLDEVWNIDYSFSKENLSLQEIGPRKLQITGAKNWGDTRHLLNKWCCIKARPVFKSMLEKLAEEHGFHFNRLTIRSQKTRWGSCSSSKNINLNSKLLFLPEEVVAYVMIHELCHTIEMNHSDRFWRLVKECDHDFLKKKERLKILGKHIFL